jgi:hypothetical protein
VYVESVIAKNAFVEMTAHARKHLVIAAIVIVALTAVNVSAIAMIQTLVIVVANAHVIAVDARLQQLQQQLLQLPGHRLVLHQRQQLQLQLYLQRHQQLRPQLPDHHLVLHQQLQLQLQLYLHQHQLLQQQLHLVHRNATVYAIA